MVTVYSKEDFLGDQSCQALVVSDVSETVIRDYCEECYVNIPDSYKNASVGLSPDRMGNSDCSHIVSYILCQCGPFGEQLISHLN
jgi:hypothetical protein